MAGAEVEVLHLLVLADDVAAVTVGLLGPVWATQLRAVSSVCRQEVTMSVWGQRLWQQWRAAASSKYK